jgi:hypothetical protein
MDIRIAGKFRLGRKIGGGSFGDIYLGMEQQLQHKFYFNAGQGERNAPAA